MTAIALGLLFETRFEHVRWLLMGSEWLLEYYGLLLQAINIWRLKEEAKSMNISCQK